MFGTFIYNFFAFVQDNCRTQWWSNDGNLGVVHSHIQRLNAFQPLNLEKVTNRVINDVRIIFRQLLPPLKNIKYKDLSEKKKYLGGKCMLEVVVGIRDLTCLQQISE